LVNKLVPTSDYEKKMVAKALADKEAKIKPLTQATTKMNTPLTPEGRSKMIKRGATRPPAGFDMFRTLLE